MLNNRADLSIQEEAEIAAFEQWQQTKSDQQQALPRLSTGEPQLLSGTYDPVTRAIAQDILIKHNIGNRPVSRSNLEKKKKSRRDGEWRMTPQSPVFDVRGRLVDGQKTLMAIMETGIAGPVYFHFGLDVGAIPVLDDGQKRSVADNFAIAGLVSTRGTTEEAMAHILYNIERKAPWSNSRASSATLVPFAQQKGQPFLEAAHVGKSIAARLRRDKSNSITKCPDAAVGIAYYLLRESPHRDEIVDEFVSRFRDGIKIDGHRDPIRWLRIGLGDKSFVDPPEVTAAIVKTFNLWIRGKRCHGCNPLKRHDRNEPFPEVI